MFFVLVQFYKHLLFAEQEKCLPGSMLCMIRFQSRFVTKATHTLLRSRQVFSDPAHSKGLDLVLGASVLWSLVAKHSSEMALAV